MLDDAALSKLEIHCLWNDNFALFCRHAAKLRDIRRDVPPFEAEENQGEEYSRNRRARGEDHVIG